MSDLFGYLFVGGVAAAVTAITTPLVAKFARQYGWMATPDERRSHPEPNKGDGGDDNTSYFHWRRNFVNVVNEPEHKNN